MSSIMKSLKAHAARTLNLLELQMPAELRSLSARTFLAVACLGLILASGCSEDHSLADERNPADPDVSGLTPPVPTELSASVESRAVTLNWSIRNFDEVDEIEKYRIYRFEPGDAFATRADSTDAPPLRMTGLDNGTTYRFQVSTVLRNGLEGSRSNAITAVPAIFGIVLGDGQESTNSRQVVLTSQAPGGTQGMKIANNADLESEAVRPFSSVLNWTVTPGDGNKTVYAQFFDAEGNASPVVSDQINLDTRAEIVSVTFSPTDVVPGQTLSIRLDADEAFGTATVELGENGRQVTLRDDGTSGDATADDGVYSADYEVENDLQLYEDTVTGFFTDQAGNTASPRLAAGRLTVTVLPEAVTLAAPTSASPQELTLSWNQAPDALRFNNYRVYRGDDPGVFESDNKRLLTEIFSRAQTSYTDENLDPDKTYYYVVEVRDSFGNGTPSNEVSGRPRANLPPDPIVLEPPTEVSEEAITLNFSRSFAEDFAAYRIVRALDSDVLNDPDRNQVARLTDITTTTFTDRADIEENRVYYYVVLVVDQFGAESASNVVSATTPDRLPTAVSLFDPGAVGETSVLLNWSENTDLDFDRYEVRRDTDAGISEDSPLIVTAADADATSYLDRGLVENTEYFYRVFVRDRGGNTAGSTELSVRTQNADPPAVTLSTPSEDGGAQTPSVALSWSGSNVHDFEQYRVFRDTSPGVSTASTAVRSIFDQDVTAFTDTGLLDNTQYYYRVFVEDDAGGSTGSNERSLITANRAPTPVELRIAGTTSTSISLAWSQNDDADFDEYRLLQGTSDSSFPIQAAQFDQREQTGHTVFVADSDSTVYFFKLVVYDQDIDSVQRLSTDSNVVSGQADQ